MSIVFSRNGLAQIGDWLAGTSTLTQLEFKLFKNDTTGNATSDSTDFTSADFTGYAAVSTDRTDYDATDDGTGATWFHNAAVSFDSTDATAQTVYGYFCEATDGTTSIYVGSELLVDSSGNPSPYTFNSGGTLTFTPKWTLRTA